MEELVGFFHEERKEEPEVEWCKGWMVVGMKRGRAVSVSLFVFSLLFIPHCSSPFFSIGAELFSAVLFFRYSLMIQ